VDFLIALEQTSVLAANYCLFAYPIVNPSGFEADTRTTSQGVNIPEQIWKNSSFLEVQNLQSELWMHAFDGIISFQTDPSADELTIAIAGPLFARHFLGAALNTAQDFLPQVVKSDLHALPKWKSVNLDNMNDLIRAAPGQKPRPFEIVITIPRQAPLFLQKAAGILLLKTVLTEYRKFIAFGANI
jgi:protein MpaA